MSFPCREQGVSVPAETKGAPAETTLLLLLFAGTMVCEFLRIGKNRKNKYPQIFLPTHLALWCMCNHKLGDVCHFGTCIIILFWSFLPFFTSLPCHHELAKVTFDDIDRGSFTSKRKLCSYRITGARCTIWHFSQIYTRVEYEDYIAANSVQALPHLLSKWILKLSLYLGCAKSQKLIPAKSLEPKNRKILYSQIIVTLR